MKDENLMAVIAYVFGLLSGLIVYFSNKEKYARFHAVQSMLLFIVFFLVWLFIGLVALMIKIIPLTGLIVGIIFLLISLGLGGIWLLISLSLMYRAYNGEKYKLPLLGEIAETLS